MGEGATTEAPDKATPVADSTDNTQTPVAMVNEGTDPNAPRPEQAATTNTADKVLPPVSIEGADKPAPPRLDQQTLDKKAEELHDAIHRKNNWKFWDRDNPDKEAIARILEPLSKEDRAALEKAYHDKYDKNGGADTLRRELKDKLGGDNSVDWRKTEAVLNRDNNRTNDAGALMVAITHARDDKDKGSAEVRQVFATLNSRQIAQLDQDFQKAYGMSYKEALEKANLTDSTKAALPYLEKGTDKKSAEDVVAMANIAVEKGDTLLFGDALRGDSPAAVEGRRRLMQDEGFKQKMADKFPSDEALQYEMNGLDPKTLPWEKRVDQAAIDYLQEGRISLATITSQNTGKWILDNKENIELAARNASEKERRDFSRGRELALAGQEGSTPEDKEALAFYNKIHKAFDDGGNDREVRIWEDQLMHGRETIVSQLAKGHSDGWGPFNWGDGHSMQDLMTKVENLSQDDWKLLNDPKTGPGFRKQLEDSLGYADEGERKRIMDLIDKKAKAPSYEESTKIGRSIQETIQDNKGNAFLWWGTSYDGKNITNKLETINADEAKKYKDDPAFKAELDKFVKENLGGDERLLAERMLAKIGTDGQPPKLDAVDKLLKDKINGAKPEELLKDAEAALKADDALRQRLSLPYDQLNENERRLKGIIENSVSAAYYSRVGIPPEGGDYPQVQEYSKQIFSKEGLSLDAKLQLGYPKQDLLPEIAKAPQEVRDRVISGLSSDEQRVVRVIAENNGQVTLADKMRMFTIGSGGNPADFKEELKKLEPAQIQQLKDEYSKKYGVDLDNSFLEKIDKKERNAYKDLLTPHQTDGRQTFYENYSAALKSLNTGFSADGSGDTVTRSLDESANMLERYQSIYQTLPKEKQEALDKFFNDSLEQYKDSKEKLASLAATVVITAAALAATPFTGGASLAVVAAVAFAAGGATKVGLSRLIQGDDYESNKIFGDFVGGGTEAGLNFFGGKFFQALSKGFSGVGSKVGGELLEQGLIKGASRETVDAALTKLVQAEGKNLTDDGLNAFVKSVSPNATAAEAEALKQAVRTSVNQNYDTIIGAATNEATQEATNNGTRALMQRLGIATFDNAAAGAGADAISAVVNAQIDGRPINMSEVLNAAVLGATIGAVTGVAIHGAIEGRDIHVRAKRTANGAEIQPAAAGETPIRIRDSAGNERVLTEPGTLKPGETIIDGPVVHPHPNAANPDGPSGRDISPVGHLPPGANPSNLGDLPTQSIRPKDVEVMLNGQPLTFKDGQVVVGRSLKTADGSPFTESSTVSREHGTLRYDQNSNTLHYRDHSTNGTYVRRAGSDPNDPNAWEFHKGGEEFKVNPDDEIRLGGKDGPRLDLISMKPPEVKLTARADVDLYVGDTYVPLRDGETLQIGRKHKLGERGGFLDDTRVSNNHGELRWNEADKSFYFKDTSSNGTYIKREGSNEYVRVQGQEVKIGPNDDVRLGSMDGPRLELYQHGRGTNAPRLERQEAFLNGQPLGHGKIEIGAAHQNLGERDVVNSLVSRNHGTLQYDGALGQYRYTDHSGNGTYIRRAGSTEFERVHNADTILGPNDEIRLGSVDGPQLDITAHRGRQLQDGSVMYQSANGDVIKRPDGTTVYNDKAGIHRIENPQGQTTSVWDAQGRSRTFSYGADGQLDRVVWNDGLTYTRSGPDSWTVQQPGQAPTEWRGKMSVERDGSLRFDNGTHPPSVNRLDGSVEVHHRNGRIEYAQADINVERGRFSQILDNNFNNPAQRQRMLDMARQLESRGLPPQEVALTYHHLNRLMQAGPESALNQAERLRLSEQIMYQAAYPHLIDQGKHLTCNVTTVENRVFTQRPSEAAALITDVATTGKYTAANGQVVDMRRTGSLKPDAESGSAFGKPFVPGQYGDIKLDGQRSWAGQIFEDTAVNLHWQNHARAYGYSVGPRDVVLYRQETPDPTIKGDTGERLYKYTTGPDGKFRVEPILDHKGRPVRSPAIYESELTDIYNQIVPGKDPTGNLTPGRDGNFVITPAGRASASPTFKPGDAIEVSNVHDLTRVLTEGQQQGKMPMVLFVDTSMPPFGNGQHISGGAHVINVQSIRWVNEGGVMKPKIEFTNQWGAHRNFLGPNAVDADVLWQAVRNPPPKPNP
jgi:YD repeat-containing protein